MVGKVTWNPLELCQPQENGNSKAILQCWRIAEVSVAISA